MPDLNIQALILETTAAKGCELKQQIQSLWSGYGRLDRYRLHGAEYESVIVKHINPPATAQHPRGWNTDISHQRKLRSYQVERYWYEHVAGLCPAACRVPACLAIEQLGEETVLLLEDLDQAGFPRRLNTVDDRALQACLAWLAHFHARFISHSSAGLWPSGSYWHLETRPDEWQSMADGALKQQAESIDQALKAAPFSTLIHGDAKLANFCFSRDHRQVAAVDFQYVGAGCGMKDLAYFISSCFTERECQQRESELLDTYFSYLSDAIKLYQPQLDAAEVEAAWRPMYAFAWADFYRFLLGWSPGHWKIHGYSEAITAAVIQQLEQQRL